MFIYMKDLGYVKTRDGKDRYAYMLTVRDPSMYIPTSSLLVGEILDDGSIRRLEWGLASRQMWRTLHDDASETLIKLNQCLKAEVTEEGPLLPEVIMSKTEGNIYIVAYREKDEAVPFALQLNFQRPSHGSGWHELELAREIRKIA